MADDAALDIAENAIRAVRDRISTLTQARDEIEAQIAELEAQAAATAEAAERDAAADEIERLAAEVSALEPSFDASLGRFSELMARAGLIVPEAGAVGVFAEGVRKEVRMAIATIAPMLQSAATHTRTGFRPLRPIVQEPVEAPPLSQAAA